MERSFRDKLSGAVNALTFGDVILLPGWVEVEPKDVDVRAKVTRGCEMSVPFISSPMDTVTGNELAVAMARQGGLGILHRNCTIEEQVEMAKKVKKAESLVIRDVITVNPDQTIKEAIDLMKKHGISGLPVVIDDRIMGIVTNRDVRFAQPNLKVEDVMTKELVTAREGITIEEAEEILHKNKIEKLPIVDDAGELRGLITFKDIVLRGQFPNALRDEEGRLLCGAAISPFDLARAKELDRYVDVLVIDVAHFHNRNVFEATKTALKEVSAEVVAGNIGTYEAAEDAITKLKEVAGFRVGVGSGSICVTTQLTKAGSPTLYAVAQVADAVAKYGGDIPVIADGGIRTPGDIALALAAGASAVMMGNIFARSKEAPGELIAIGEKYYKQYRGMASPSAMAKRHSADRYAIDAKGIAEGVEGYVPFKGDLATIVQELTAGLKVAMGYAGAKNISELQKKARFAALTAAGIREAGPHDVVMPSES